ncbi:hypothetical protein [Thalassotalea euphylliae]|uniref:PEP-CTERM sorting domain-containing protein n=1 Tax=Thalassotalea euphylliae TaxID=1655234 RepID=A0A3E0UI69_9GAMM|nr:hypothetical protein [Thalassotalea euphylliae]REL36566.1 hypothetical protein DXX92_15275 [Thalassotalea euphylliae]
MNKLIVSTLLTVVVITQSAFATIIHVAPTSLNMNSLESDFDVFLIEERQNFTLTDDLVVDQLVDLNSLTPEQNAFGEIIGHGTAINSFLFHADAVGSNAGANTIRFYNETFVFDTEILALIWTGPDNSQFEDGKQLLTESDYLANIDYFTITGPEGQDVNGNKGVGRGLESSIFQGTDDFFRISNDLRTIEVDFKVAPKWADQLRVITAVEVPVPSTIPIILSSLCLMIFFRIKST